MHCSCCQLLTPKATNKNTHIAKVYSKNFSLSISHLNSDNFEVVICGESYPKQSEGKMLKLHSAWSIGISGLIC